MRARTRARTRRPRSRPRCPRVQAKVAIGPGADQQGARSFIGGVGSAWLGAVVFFGGIAVLNGFSS